LCVILSSLIHLSTPSVTDLTCSKRGQNAEGGKEVLLEELREKVLPDRNLSRTEHRSDVLRWDLSRTEHCSDVLSQDLSRTEHCSDVLSQDLSRTEHCSDVLSQDLSKTEQHSDALSCILCI
jgi:hypothetical protein